MLNILKQVKNRVAKLHSFSQDLRLPEHFKGQLDELRHFVAESLTKMANRIEGREKTHEDINDIMTNCRVQDRDGNLLNPFGLEAKDFRPELFAESLAAEMRFWNQTRLSVAEHCVNLANAIEKEFPGRKDLAQWALFHELFEAYTGDLATPFKRCLPEYKQVEDAALGLFAQSVGLSKQMPYEVHLADKRMMISEALAYMPDNEFWLSQAKKIGENEFGEKLEPYPVSMLKEVPLGMDEAATVFAQKWIELELPVTPALEAIAARDNSGWRDMDTCPPAIGKYLVETQKGNVTFGFFDGSSWADGLEAEAWRPLPAPRKSVEINPAMDIAGILDKDLNIASTSEEVGRG